MKTGERVLWEAMRAADEPGCEIRVQVVEGVAGPTVRLVTQTVVSPAPVVLPGSTVTNINNTNLHGTAVSWLARMLGEAEVFVAGEQLKPKLGGACECAALNAKSRANGWTEGYACSKCRGGA